MSARITAIEKDSFRLIPSTAADGIEVKVSGSCDAAMLPLLEGFLRTLHTEATRTGVRNVTLDCHELYFLNSAAIKVVVTWLNGIRVARLSERYRVGVRLNQRLAWQERTFGTIRRSAPEVMDIE